MKPAVHRIPLTVDERAFLNAVLGAAMDRGLNQVTPAAAIIANSPARADGLIDVVLEDGDRAAVRDLFAKHSMGDLEISRIRRPVAPEAQQRFDFATGAWPTEVTCDWNEGAACRHVVTTTYTGTLIAMFDDYDFDKMPAVKALRADGRKDFFVQAGGPYLGNIRSDIFTRVFRHGYYVTDPNAGENRNARIDVVADACKVLEAARLLTLREAPKTRRQHYDRVHLDWNWQMYRPPTSRRPSPETPSLSKAEDEAIEGIAA